MKATLKSSVVSAVLFLAALVSSAQTSQTDDALGHAKSVYSEQGPKAALPEYEKVLESYRKENNRRGEAITLGLIGNCYKRMGDYTRALANLNTALQIKREIGDKPEEGRTLSHLGLVYWEQGEYAKATEALNESISIAREVKDAKLEAASLNNLSLVYDEQGDYKRSLEQYQQALQLHRTVGYEPGQSDTLGNIGGVYLLLGRYSEAGDYYKQALSISERLKLKPSQTQDLGNLGLCELGKGNIRSSIDIFDRAIAIAHDAGLSKEEADWYRAKGSALVKLGRFDVALTNFVSARKAYEAAGLKRELLEVLQDLGDTHLGLGDRKSGEKFFAQSQSLASAIGNKRGVFNSRLAIAQFRFASGEYHSAAVGAKAALSQARSLDDGPATVAAELLLSRIYRKQRRTSEALRLAQQAHGFAQGRALTLLDSEALDLIGELKIRSKQFAEALVIIDQARAIATSSGDTDLAWKTNYHRGQALEGLGCNDEALTSYRDSVQVIESVRSSIREQRFRTGYLQQKQDVYIALVRLLLKLGKPADAFEFSERLREYSFRVQREAPNAELSDTRVVELQSRIRRLQDLVEQERGKPAADQRAAALHTFSDELLEAQRQYRAVIDSGGSETTPQVTVSVAVLRDRLPPRTALLEYVVDRERVVIFVLTRKGLRATTSKISETDLNAKVELLRALIKTSSSDEWQKPAASLRNLLISPLEQKHWLAGIDSLLLIPHGILHYLPFPALVNVGSAESHVLVESYTLAELPSATSLLTETAKGKTTEGVIAFAPSRTRLQFAIPEAEEVARSFGGSSRAVVGQRATETRFKETASRYELIHIATHGYFNRVNPAFSGLQLEPDSINDGRLEVHEIANLRLNTRLVTLSACDTGLGAGDFNEMPAGDEFVGLNRAFLEAGSGAVLATLWEVNDRSTLVLMKRLYRAISQGRGVEALAEAQREMLKDPSYKHPYYWSAFTYIGKDFNLSPTLAEKR